MFYSARIQESSALIICQIEQSGTAKKSKSPARQILFPLGFPETALAKSNVLQDALTSWPGLIGSACALCYGTSTHITADKAVRHSSILWTTSTFEVPPAGEVA